MLVSANFADVSTRTTIVSFNGDAQGRDEYNECFARWKDEGGYVPPVTKAEKPRYGGTVYTQPRAQTGR